MNNIALVISHKNSTRSEYFFNNLCLHRNIQKINLHNYDRIEKFLQTKNIKSDYLKNPKFFCEKLTYNYQLSFKPFLDYFFYFFVIEKPRNVIKSKDEINHYCLRLRRMYEILYKAKNKIVILDDQVYLKETYDKCFGYLGLSSIKKNFKIPTESSNKGIFDEETEDFYEKYRYKITKSFLN